MNAHEREAVKLLSCAVLSAQKIREESWIADGLSVPIAIRNGQYTKSHLEAAREACGPPHAELVQVVFMLNKYSWNDAQDWANEFLDGDDAEYEK